MEKRIEQIIADKLSNDYNIWNDVLNNTEPGNYGVNDWEVSIDPSNITFNKGQDSFCAKGHLTSELVIGESNGELTSKYNKDFSIKGDYINGEIIKPIISIDQNIY